MFLKKQKCYKHHNNIKPMIINTIKWNFSTDNDHWDTLGKGKV